MAAGSLLGPDKNPPEGGVLISESASSEATTSPAISKTRGSSAKGGPQALVVAPGRSPGAARCRPAPLEDLAQAAATAQTHIVVVQAALAATGESTAQSSSNSSSSPAARGGHPGSAARPAVPRWCRRSTGPMPRRSQWKAAERSAATHSWRSASWRLRITWLPFRSARRARRRSFSRSRSRSLSSKMSPRPAGRHRPGHHGNGLRSNSLQRPPEPFWDLAS